MEISIESAKKEDLPAIIEIANLQLGTHYLTSTLSTALNNKGYLLKVAKLAYTKIVGLCLTTKNKNEIVLKSIAIHPNYTQQGIATLLVSDSIDYAQANKYNSIKCIAWKSQNGIQLAGIFKRFDFKKVDEITNYWKQNSLEKEYTCPTCGKPPCLCTAVLFEKYL